MSCLVASVYRFLAITAHSTRNLVMASVQRCAAQHPGRRAAETVCRQFQCPRLHFSRRHLRQYGFPGDTVYPSAQESGAAKTLSSSQGVCAGLGDCPVSGRQLGTRASLCRLLAPDLGRCIGGSATDCNLCAPAAQHGNLSRQGSGCCRCRCSLLGCRPSPRQPSWRGPDGWCRAARTACRAGSSGAFAASGGVSCLFRRGQEAWGSFCAGPRRPSWAVRGLAAPAVAWLWCSTGLPFPALPLNSPAHRSRTSPGNTGNEPPAASPRKESTLETPADPLPPLSCLDFSGNMCQMLSF